MHITRTGILTQVLAVAGLSAVLLTTGCATPAPNQPGPTASASETASGVPTPPAVEASPSATTTILAGPEEEDPYGWGLVAAPEVSAGSDLKVSGGRYTPGTKVTVYGAEQMAPPSHDAVNDMDVAAEEVILTDKVEVVANDKGQFDTKIPVPAGVKPQMMNVVAVGIDGSGFLVMTTVK
jgi:hypothetical protein